MITFTIGKDGYFIDDDFNVITGKNKKEIQKDIDLFFMDIVPSSGDDVLLYKERLENVFGADVKDYYSIKYPEGTVDCAEYENFGQKEMAKDSLLDKVKRLFIAG